MNTSTKNRKDARVSKSAITTFLLLGVIILAGCQKSQSDDMAGSVTLNYAIDDVLTIGTDTRTTTVASEKETTVNEVVMIYYKSGTTKSSGYSIDNIPRTGLLGSVPIMLPSPMLNFSQTQGDYDVIVLANFNKYLPAGYTATTTYITKVLTNKSFADAKTAVEFHTKESITTPLPMYGTTTLQLSGAGIKMDPVALKRAVSRVDVYNKVHNKESRFALESAKLCNFRKSFKPYDIANASKSVNATIPSTAVAATGGKIETGLYCFPNSVTIPRQSDATSSYIMVKGNYNSLGATFYRVNIVNDKPIDGFYSQTLAANMRYELNIFDVEATGETIEADAKTAAIKQIKTSVEQEHVEHTVTDLGGNYIYASDVKVVLNGAGASNKQEINISVNALDRWTATKSGDFFDLATNYGAPNTPTANSGTITITAKAAPHATEVRRGTVIIKHGGNQGLTLTIDVIQ